MRPGPVGLVAGREVVERTRTKSFRISTAVYVLAAAAAVVIPGVVGDDGPATYDLGVVGRTPTGFDSAVAATAEGAGARVRLRPFTGRAEAEAAVREEEVDAVVVDGERLIVAEEDGGDRLVPLVNQALAGARLQDRLARAGVPEAESAALLAAPTLPVDELEPSSRQDNRPVVFAGIILIYISLLTYGSQVATGVVEEKSSRISEVLLGALRPSQLLGGKVIGIGLVGVLQLLAIGAGVLVASVTVESVGLPEGSALTLLSVLLWFVLGYAFYSCAFAAAGASVSSAEEIGGATAPMNVVLIVSYFAATGAIGEPDGTVAKVLSFIPLLTPMTMLPRAALGDVAIWEVPLAVALVAVSSYALVRLGGRVYSGAILRSGKVKLREAWRGTA